MNKCVPKAGAWPGALSNVVKFGFGACIPKQRPVITCAITAYPAARTSLFGTKSACSSGIHVPRPPTSVSDTERIMADSQAQQIEAAGWSKEALEEAITKGALDDVLHWIGTTTSNAVSEDAAASDGLVSTQRTYEILAERAGELPIVRGISSVLSKPIKTKDDFWTACAGLDGILSDLPLATLGLYRPALETLAAADSEDSPPGVSVHSLASRAKDAVKFIDYPELTWAPQHKFDYMGERSLSERVHTADGMKPHVRELLDWLADYNWPPMPGCLKQLARFPEVTINPIKEIISKNGNDPEWLLHLVEFVERDVPVGMLWEKMEPELTLFVNNEADDEESVELSETAQRMLGLLKEWQREQGAS